MSDATAVGDDRTPLERALILGTLVLATTLYAMTVTIANVVLPQMQGSLSATQDQISLVVTFNIVATAIATPMTGWLVARFGRRRLMLGCIVTFTLASLACATADSLWELVFYRVCQGLFGAPLVPLSQAIALETYPRRLHGIVTAIYGMGVVLGPIIGPTVGGYLSEAYSWRMVFVMIVPVGIVSLLGAWALIHERGSTSQVRFDWTGFLALSVAIAACQFMLDRGERQGWFDSSEIVVEAGLAALGLYVLIVHTATAERPFVNPVLFRDRNFALGLCFTFVFGMLNFTPMTLLPPLLQNLQGYPDDIIGLLLGARGAGTLLGFTTNAVVRTGIDPRLMLLLGFGSQAIAGLWMASFDINVTTMDVALSSALAGFGVGICWVPLTITSFATLAPKYLPDGSALFHLLRNFGSSVHISLSVAVVLHYAKVNYSDLRQNVSPFNEALLYPQTLGLWSIDSTRGLAGIAGEVQRQAAMIGYINGFYFFAATAFCVLPFLALIRLNRPER